MQFQNNKISIAIITYNCKRTIKKCITSIYPFADDIIIVDSNSSDGSIDIIKNFKKISFYTRKFDSFSNQRNYAIKKCRNDWIFFIDSDEEISYELGDFLLHHQLNLREYYSFLRKNYFFGKISLRVLGKDPQIRLFNKHQGSFKGVVHERFVPNCDIKLISIKKYIIHHGDISFEKRLEKINRYSILHSQIFINRSIFFIIMRLLKEIFIILFIRLGFLDPKRCFMWILIRIKYHINIIMYLMNNRYFKKDNIKK